MKRDNSNLFTLAKYINKELLVEEMFRFKGLAAATYLSNFNKSKRILKIKIIITKIFYSIIFGILPVIPLITYFIMQRETFGENLPISVIIYGGSILFIFFFILQFLNVFFMGMTEVSVIMSNNLFHWLETLPISSKNLSRLKLISIVKNFDIPIIVIVFAFPIVMLIGTLNFILFLVCLGISIFNAIFSFSVLILFGERINRILDINMINSRKTMIIRLISIFGYVIVFFGTLIFVQWAISSIPYFFEFPMVQRHPEILNLILSTIPYPFSSSYLISFLSTTNQIHPHYWISMFCGLGLFIILVRQSFIKALKGLDRITSSKGTNLKKFTEPKPKEIKIKVKIRSPIIAHFIKDLSITSRNIKVFLSVITPIIISFVFTYTFNFTVLRGQTPLGTDFFYNWAVILAMQPIICGMLIYNLINLEGSTESILIALPTSPKNQAKAKLLYFTLIQTISVISPYLIYINDPRFMEVLQYVSISLLFAWIILFSMFEMYIYLFGRKKYRFVLEPVHPENKMIKWAFLYISEYIFYIIIVSTGVVLNFIGLQFFIFNFSLFLIAGYCILFLMFKMIFSPTLKPKPLVPPPPKPKSNREIDRPLLKSEYIISPVFNFISRHPWLSISLFLLFDILCISLGSLYVSIIQSILDIDYFYMEIPYFFLFLFCVFPLLILIFINIKFIPKYRGELNIEFNRSQKIFKILKYGILGTISVISIHYIFVLVGLIPSTLEYSLYLNYDIFFILTIFMYSVWQEVLFRGILFPILLTKFRKNHSIGLNAIIFFIYHYIYCIYLFISYGTFTAIFSILFYLAYMVTINIFLTYLFTKQHSIYPAVLVHFLTSLFGMLPMFYSGYQIFFAILIM